MSEAIAEAKRCLNCKVPQCKKGCPVSNDIPDWIHELSMGNLGNAMAIINAKSNLPAVCGRVCARERQCEGNCVLGKKGAHINIGKLERFVSDFDTAMNLTREKLVRKDRGRVAVIGSGPAGLTIAGELARKGVAVEIFEMEREAGGVLMFGIPEYRLPKDVVKKEIAKIEQLGVTIHCSTTVGYDLTVDDLFNRGFDAVFMGTGTGKPKRIDIPASRIVSTTQGIEVDEKGYVITREFPYGMTTRKGVFAGGDVTNSPATVVHAMQDAQKVADGMLRYLEAIKLLETIDK